MDLISSDTNVWIDFATISRLTLPFLLPYTYLMHQDTIEHELLFPHGLAEALMKLGLKGVELTLEEFQLTEKYGSLYHRLSVFDCTALAIARELKHQDTGTVRQSIQNRGEGWMGHSGVLEHSSQTGLDPEAEGRKRPDSVRRDGCDSH